MNNVDLFSLTYSEAEDAFYAIEGRGQLRIVRYDADGQRTNRLDLSHFLLFEPWWQYQLVATGDKLALISPPLPDLYAPHLPPQVRRYLIDPASGEVMVMGVIPEPGCEVVMAALGMIGMVLRRRV